MLAAPTPAYEGKALKFRGVKSLAGFSLGGEGETGKESHRAVALLEDTWGFRTQNLRLMRRQRESRGEDHQTKTWNHEDSESLGLQRERGLWGQGEGFGRRKYREYEQSGSSLEFYGAVRCVAV